MSFQQKDELRSQPKRGRRAWWVFFAAVFAIIVAGSILNIRFFRGNQLAYYLTVGPAEAIAIYVGLRTVPGLSRRAALCYAIIALGTLTICLLPVR